MAGVHGLRSQHNVTKGGKRYLAGVDPVPAEGVFVGTHFGGRNAWPMVVEVVDGISTNSWSAGFCGTRLV